MIVAFADVERWGCPECGYRSGSIPIQCGGAGVWRCGECGKGCIALADGLTAVPDSWVDDRGKPVERHPREGTPAHGRSDRRPDSGGEFFSPRGIGMDSCQCFCCPKSGSDGRELMHNVAAFVQCRESGERVVRMFGRGAWLDYRDFEPDRVQVKVGACDAHREQLEALYRATREGGVIRYGMIQAARGCGG